MISFIKGYNNSNSNNKKTKENNVVVNEVNNSNKYRIFMLEAVPRLLIGLAIWCLSVYGFSVLWIFIFLSLTMMREIRLIRHGHKLANVKKLKYSEKAYIRDTLENIPFWVMFPDLERTEWLNKIILQIWPFVTSYIRDVLTFTVIPLVNSVLPSILRPCTLTSLNLGDVAPRIGGMKVIKHEISRKSIILDAEVCYHGNAEIVIQFGRFQLLTAGVKDIEIIGRMRFNILLIGGISITFLNIPTVRYSLTDYNILAIPGLNDYLHAAVVNAVTQNIVLPNRIAIPFGNSHQDNQLLRPPPQGVLLIRLVEGKSLAYQSESHWFSKDFEPYCTFTIGAQTFYSKASDSSILIHWDQYFEAIVDQMSGQNLYIRVYSIGTTDEDNFLGSATIDLESVWRKGKMQSWIMLEGVKSGMLHLVLTFADLSEEPFTILKNTEEKALNRRGFSSAILSVFLDHGKNIKTDLAKISPFVKFQIIGAGDEKETVFSHVCANTTEPVWQNVFYFLISEITKAILVVKVKDDNTKMDIGTITIDLTKLLTANEMQIKKDFPFDDPSTCSGMVSMNVTLRGIVSKERTQQTMRTAMSVETKQTCSSLEGDTASHTFVEWDPLEQSLLEADILRYRNTEGSDIPMIHASLKYRSQEQVLCVTIHKARNIGVNFDDEETLVLMLTTLPQNFANNMMAAANGTDKCNPNFNNKFRIRIDEELLNGSSIQISFRIQHQSGKYRIYGTSVISVCDIESLPSISNWYTIYPGEDAPTESSL